MAVRAALGAERVEDKAIAEDAKNGIIRPRKAVQGLTIGGQPLPQGGGRGFGPGAGGEAGPPPGR